MIWTRSRLKHLAAIPITNGVGEPGAFDDPEWPRYVRTTDIAGPRTLRTDVFASLPPETAARAPLRRGDIVMTTAGATVGKSMLFESDEPACYAGYLARFRPAAGVDPRFVSYWTESRPYLDQVSSGKVVSTIDNFSAGKYQNLWIDVPDLVEQHAIADYLDTETSQIDALIELRRHQMSLSSARRFESARAAFRGRDASTSRLAWIPGVPLDWPVMHLRWLTVCLDGRRIPVNREDRASMQGSVPYWGANGVVDHVDAALFDEPLVLLGEDGAPFFDREKPKAFFVDTPVWVNNHIHVLRPHGIRPQFLTHYLNLVDYADFVGGSTRDKLTQDDMGSIPVPVPPVVEQERIEREISVSQRWTDRFESATERQINLLTERRQALITAAVTGQLEIPTAAA